MRTLLVLALLATPSTRVWACSCMGPGSPSHAAGGSAAVFIGKVSDITAPPAMPHFPVANGGRASAHRPPGSIPLPRSLRTVRMQVLEVFSGVATSQKEIEVATGQGDADCGFRFQPGVEYVVYAHRNAEDRLETSICTRTRELARAAEDLQYFRAMANAPATADLRVLTAYPGTPPKPGVRISVEGEGSRYTAVTNAAGDARFKDLPPGKYTVHADSDGDLPDDPTVEVHAKGSVDVTLFRILRITGRVATKNGQPAARVEVQVRSAQDTTGEGRMTDPDGRYELQIYKPASTASASTSAARRHETPHTLAGSTPARIMNRSRQSSISRENLKLAPTTSASPTPRPSV